MSPNTKPLLSGWHRTRKPETSSWVRAGARKVRWKRAGSGKSSGTRVVYYHLVSMEQILLVAAYAKAERENMPAHEITKLVD